MRNLLEETRKINRMLQRAAGQPVDFSEVAQVLSETVGANAYVISRKGKLLGKAVLPQYANESLAEENRIPEEFNKAILEVKETAANAGGLKESPFAHTYVAVVPVTGKDDRIGTMLLGRSDRPFDDEDIILSEYGATVISMEMLRSRFEEGEQEARSRAAVQVAIDTLSFSEMEAMKRIFAELEGPEGLLVASKIADEAGITRSVIVNALRKLESAGVIQSRSLGMKGTYIKVLNESLLQEFARRSF